MTNQLHFRILLDVTIDGEPCYIAYPIEASGCIGQGDTPSLAYLDCIKSVPEFDVKPMTESISVNESAVFCL